MQKLLSVITLLCGLTFTEVFSQSPANFLERPNGLAIDKLDNVYVTYNDGLARISPDGTIKKLSDKHFGLIAIDSKGTFYLAYSASIWKMTIDKNDNCTFEFYAGDKNYGGARDGERTTCMFSDIEEMFVDQNDVLVVADRAWQLLATLGNSYEKTVIEPGVPTRNIQPSYWCYIRYVNGNKVTSLKNDKGQYVLFNNLAGMTVDGAGDIIYSGGGFSRAVRKWDVRDNRFQTIAGKPFKREHCPVYIVGDTSKAELFTPGYITLDHDGNIVYTDGRNHRITKIANGKVSTVAGNNKIQPCGDNIGGRAREEHKDGKATEALFNFPTTIAYDSKGNLFVVDSQNQCIRKITPAGMVSSFTYFERSKARINR
jgi:hypothetical protein